MKILKRIFITITLLSFFLVAVLFGMGYVSYKDATSRLAVVDVRDTLIEYIDNYTYFEDISDYLIEATIATEDHRFYDRYGIDFIALSRAFIKNILTMSIQEGGSTITQQLAQNVYYDYHRDIANKMAEYYLLYDFENNYTKDEILEMYLNIIYYGDGYTGIYDATMGYFNKLPSELSLFEASLLAGIPNAPSAYQLSTGLDLALNRQGHVLKRMETVGYISEEEKEETIALQEAFKIDYLTSE